MTKKNVAVVDLPFLAYPSYFKIESINISLLIVSDERQRKIVLRDYPYANVLLAEEITTWDKSYVSQEDILEYQHVQLQILRQAASANWGDSKQIYDAKILSMYYSSLAFWLYHFNHNLIETFLLFVSAVHGEFVDTIPLNIAKKLGVPAYHTDIILVGKNNVHLYAFKDFIHQKYIPVSEYLPSTYLSDESNVANLDRIVFSEDNTDKNDSKNRKITIYSIAKSLRDKIFASKIFILDYLVGKILHLTKYSARGLPFKLSFIQYLIFKVRNHHLKRYYNSHSVKSINENDLGILYALHFEPEASIMNRTVYNSQLYNIKMLASSLPKGWTLYVKEHPHQFKVTVGVSYFMTVMFFYRNIRYYKDISSIPNVKLLNLRFTSPDLLSLSKYPQIKAVATINGTISAEAIHAKKPVILFDSSTVPYSDIEELFVINKFDDLKKAINLIYRGYCPKYNNYSELIEKYLFVVREFHMNLPPEALLNVLNRS